MPFNTSLLGSLGNQPPQLQSLLQMLGARDPNASGGPSRLISSDGTQASPPQGGWAPSWVREQLAAYDRDAPAGSKSADIGFSGNPGSLVPYLNPDNWGPPPPAGPDAGAVGSGWFPAFSGIGNDPNEKFWSMKSYASQLPGGGNVTDESPNTRNSRLLAGGPGYFMYLGHPISESKLQYDTHRPISDPPTAGSFLPSHLFGNLGSGWSTTGEVGYPGQLDPFSTSWGAGGPGG